MKTYKELDILFNVYGIMNDNDYVIEMEGTSLRDIKETIIAKINKASNTKEPLDLTTFPIQIRREDNGTSFGGSLFVTLMSFDKELKDEFVRAVKSLVYDGSGFLSVSERDAEPDSYTVEVMLDIVDVLYREKAERDKIGNYIGRFLSSFFGEEYPKRKDIRFAIMDAYSQADAYNAYSSTETIAVDLDVKMPIESLDEIVKEMNLALYVINASVNRRAHTVSHSGIVS